MAFHKIFMRFIIKVSNRIQHINERDLEQLIRKGTPINLIDQPARSNQIRKESMIYIKQS